MTGSVRIDGNHIVVDGRKLALISGEFHYFRHDKVWWPDIFASIRDGGFKIVSSYVCWDFQELAPGEYDFRGQTSPLRDLDGFLTACAAEGLYVTIRPGPYIASEWKHCGIPDHATPYHRLHPEFLARARHYIDAVCEVIRPHLATNGGPVILVQADNEVDLNVQEYNPTEGYPVSAPEYLRQIFTAAAADDPGTFPWWLRERYGSLDSLNRAYGTSFTAFEQVGLSRTTPLTQGDCRRLFDACRFFEWYSLAYLREISGMYRAGIDVPLYANVYGRPSPMNYPQMQEVVDLVGADFYLAELVTHDELLRLSFTMRHLACATAIPWIIEMQCGTTAPWLRLRGIVSPEHHRYMMLLAMLCGAKAWNWYMLVDRDEWVCSPINEKGEQRLTDYQPFKDIVRVCTETDWASLVRRPPLALFFYRAHHWLSTGAASSMIEVADVTKPCPGLFEAAWNALFDSLHRANLDFDLFDPDSKRVDMGRYPMVLAAGYDMLDEQTALQIVDYVLSGGTFVLFTAPPRQDLEGRPLPASDMLPRICSTAGWHGDLTVEVLGRQASVPAKGLRFFDLSGSPQATPIRALGATVGYVLPHGRGRFCVVGWDVGPETLAFLGQVFGVVQAVRVSDERLMAAPFVREGEVALLVLNTGLEPVAGTISLDLATLGLEETGSYSLREVFGGEQSRLAGSDLREMRVQVRGKDALLFHVTA